MLSIDFSNAEISIRSAVIMNVPRMHQTRTVKLKVKEGDVGHFEWRHLETEL